MADHTLARMGLEITSPTVEGIPFVALPPPPTMNLNNAIKMNRFELWGWFGQASAAGKISISFDQLDAVYELGLNGADFLEDQLQAKDFQGSMSKVETFTARHLVQLANEVRAKFEVTELPPSVSKKRKATEMMTGSQDAESSMIKGYRLFLSQGEAEISTARTSVIGDPVEMFSIVSSLRSLPLPGPAELFNTKRFSLEGNTFKVYDREMLGDLWKALEAVECRQGRRIYFHGCLGVGKSHLLASFAVHLLSQGRRVAFLADCRAVVAKPHMFLHRTFRLAFTDDEEAQEQIDLTKTLDELQRTVYRLCGGLDRRLILIIDQWNALDHMPDCEAADRSSNDTKRVVRDFLNKLTLVVTKIEGSGRKSFDAYRSIGEHQIPLFTGLTPREMASWWTSPRKMLYNILREDDRLELEAFTGCLPFLLKIFSDINCEHLKEHVAEASGIATHEDITDNFKSGTLYDAFITAMYEEFYKSKRASNVKRKLVKHVRDSFRENQRDPEYPIRLHDAIMSCLCNQSVYDMLIVDDIDWRFCYIDDSKIGGVSANFFRDIYFRELRDVEGVETKLSSSWTDRLTMEDARNGSVLRFKVENQVLAYIEEHGFMSDIDQHFSKPPYGLLFFKEFAGSMFDRRELFILYVPTSSSYTSADAILVSRYVDINKQKGNVLTASVMGLQITVGKRHGDKEIQYLKSTPDWEFALGVQKVLHTYVYLWENIPTNRLTVEFVPEKKRGRSTNIVHPAYTRVNLRIRDLSEKIGVNLEEVSTKMREQKEMLM